MLEAKAELAANLSLADDVGVGYTGEEWNRSGEEQNEAKVTMLPTGR